MPGATPVAISSRDRTWQHIYTLFESLALCWSLEVQFSANKPIISMDDYFSNLNAWTAFYAQLGRIHDMAERVTAAIGEKRLFKPFDEFYEKRHTVLHGIKVPMRWADNILCAPPIGERPNQWHAQMAWKELNKAHFEYLSTWVTSTLRLLEPVVSNFLHAILQHADSTLGLRPITWPDKPKPRPIYNAGEIPLSGTVACESIRNSGIHPLSQ